MSKEHGDNLDNKGTPLLSSKLERCVHYCKCSEYNLYGHRMKKNVHCIHLSGITEDFVDKREHYGTYTREKQRALMNLMSLLVGSEQQLRLGM